MAHPIVNGPSHAQVTIPMHILQNLDTALLHLQAHAQSQNLTTNLTLNNALSTMASTLSNLHSTTTSQFHYFPKLPIEIRLMIWEFAGEEPCIIGVVDPKPGTTNGYSGTNARRHLLLACREARNALLHPSEDAMVSDLNEDLQKECKDQAPKLWINFDQDIIWVRNLVDLEGTFDKSKSWVKKRARPDAGYSSKALHMNLYESPFYIERLAFPIHEWKSTYGFRWFFELSELRELILVIDSEEIGVDDTAEFQMPRKHVAQVFSRKKNGKGYCRETWEKQEAFEMKELREFWELQLERHQTAPKEMKELLEKWNVPTVKFRNVVRSRDLFLRVFSGDDLRFV